MARQKVINARDQYQATEAGSQPLIQKHASAADQRKYRDRASERRIMHNQPEAPLASEEVTTRVGKKKHAEGPAAPSPPPAAPLNPGEDDQNVGNKLLKMMGWKEGTGLGSSGEGRVEPMLVVMVFLIEYVGLRF